MKRNFDYVGPAIARLRKERHWTQEDVAMKLWQLGIYMTWQMVANIESCRRVATTSFGRPWSGSLRRQAHQTLLESSSVISTVATLSLGCWCTRSTRPPKAFWPAPANLECCT